MPQQDQIVLTVAQKGSPVAYGPLLAASFINADNVLPPVSIRYKEAALIVESDKSSNVSLQGKEGDVIYGVENVAKALAKGCPDAKLYGKREELVDEWLAFSARLAGDFKSVLPALEELDHHLQLRSVLVGYSLTVADLVIWGAIKGSTIAVGAIKKNALTNISRWFSFIEAQPHVYQAVDAMQKEINLKKKTKTASKSHTSNYDIGLQDAEEGKVCVRFPPEPSGYLHIGHAKAALLNQFFAQEYKGKLIIRFDDTNPSKEKTEFQDSILEDLTLLGIKGDVVTHTSDHFDTLYQYAIQMIKDGKAYCDDTVQEQMRAERMDGIASARRERTVEENLQIFAEMTAGTELGLKNCLRAKISVDDPNKALRDPVIYRCNLLPHHRIGDKWKVYPTYDFACPIVDCIEGVTHALRTIEYRDRNAQYQWMLDACNLRRVHVWDFSRMNFVRTLLSKRKLQWFVDQGLVGGWDDPRFPTVRGVRRRGMTIEALRQYILSQGPSKNINNLDWTSIWAINKKTIDPIAPRHTAIFTEGKVPVKLEGGPAEVVEEVRPKHKKNPELGNNKVAFYHQLVVDQDDAQTFKEGEELTLMDWGNAFVTKINKEGDKVVSLEMKLHLEGDFKKTEKKVTWLADTPALTDVELVDFDLLITKEKLEDGDDVKDFLTPQTEFRVSAVADGNVRDLKKGDVMQFNRKGYYVVDVPYTEGGKIVMFSVPDGASKNRYGVAK
ncbi:glutamyl-tRNA synthetase [Saitoella complicata NRRL Y-17804]|uniref:glutamate--tRNA ligase n=1 Tax=Saitoella complicata (strain BCRC 22490 / CBS 7301 / JCM 7358 / NBRC 10748 / NRRL Y-17804) TaxID=698492 RepID=A0A0E9NHL4_SAICN|nr:glutamyl-tRNA synthetase [Saitoella complicata NRRL Y-17804]ODQ54109.1 glutamyl-tRNA synthetase [Saitoella complicata NRRL Y-17804]GAO49181.1 hypothetical protein G7K_3339-t1 [Saitoella complicata NRRL Y-17804]